MVASTDNHAIHLAVASAQGGMAQHALVAAKLDAVVAVLWAAAASAAMYQLSPSNFPAGQPLGHIRVSCLANAPAYG